MTDVELKQRIESLLFASGQRMSVEEIVGLCKAQDQASVREALQTLKVDYETKGTSIILINDGDFWKMTVHDKFIPLVRKIVTKTELPKGVVETLAVLAYKAPLKQSELIQIRTNKAYDHLAELEKMSFIRRKKWGRTKIITLTEKFFQYFDLPQEALKEKFQRVQEMEGLIREREKEIEDRTKSQEQQKKLARLKETEHKEKLELEHQEMDNKIANLPEIDLVDKEGNKHPLPVYETTETSPVRVKEESLPVLEETESHDMETEILEEARKEAARKTSHLDETKGLFENAPPEIEKEINKKMDKLLTPEKKNPEAGQEE